MLLRPSAGFCSLSVRVCPETPPPFSRPQWAGWPLAPWLSENLEFWSLRPRCRKTGPRKLGRLCPGRTLGPTCAPRRRPGPGGACPPLPRAPHPVRGSWRRWDCRSPAGGWWEGNVQGRWGSSARGETASRGWAEAREHGVRGLVTRRDLGAPEGEAPRAWRWVPQGLCWVSGPRGQERRATGSLHKAVIDGSK